MTQDMAPRPLRCRFEVVDKIYRQCPSRAKGERDGLPACGVHLRVRRPEAYPSIGWHAAAAETL